MIINFLVGLLVLPLLLVLAILFWAVWQCQSAAMHWVDVFVFGPILFIQLLIS